MSGSGVGVPIVAPTIASGAQVFGGGCITLDRYAKLIGYSEYAFFGISDSSNTSFACRNIWRLYERNMITEYLTEAKDEIERAVGYPLCPAWIAGEEHLFQNPVMLNWGKLIELGVQVETTLASDAVINYLTDPPSISIAAPTLTDTNDIHVYYPDTEIDIVPSAVSLAAGVLTIEIPKSRLLKYDYLDNPEEGYESSDATIYQALVDIVRYSTDTSDQVNIIFDPSECDDSCTTTTEAICGFIVNADIGAIRLGALPQVQCLSTGVPRRMSINYRAGLTAMTKSVEMAIIRLAHSRMPEEPCGCDITQRLWKRDRHEPEVLTRERLNCPFGTSDGAWAAWRLAMSIASFRMSDFAGSKLEY